MRNQILLLTAALGLGAAATTMAQVYSVNAVGYVNMTLTPGLNLIGNPLDNKTSNKVKDILAGVPDGSIVYKYDSAGSKYDINFLDTEAYPPPASGWSNENQTLVPGEAAFVSISGATPVTITFVGEVMQGHLVNDIVGGSKYSLESSMVPQQGLLETDLKFPHLDGISTYFYRGGGYKIWYIDDENGGWNGPTGLGQPTVGVGEGFWTSSGIAGQWVRDFSVNQ